MIHVVPLKNLEGELSEGWSNCGVRMAFASEDNRQATQFVSCKDYMQDAIWATHTQKIAKVYGFTYNPETDPPLDLENTRILIRFFGKHAMAAPKVLDMLNQIERELSFKQLTEMFETDLKGTVLYVSSKDWMLSTVTISFFTLLFRLGAVHEVGTPWRDTVTKIINQCIPAVAGGDFNLAKPVIPAVDLWRQVGLSSAFGQSNNFTVPRFETTHTLHNDSGLQAYAKKSPILLEPFSHWKFLDSKIKDTLDEDYYDDEEDYDDGEDE